MTKFRQGGGRSHEKITVKKKGRAQGNEKLTMSPGRAGGKADAGRGKPSVGGSKTRRGPERGRGEKDPEERRLRYTEGEVGRGDDIRLY